MSLYITYIANFFFPNCFDSTVANDVEFVSSCCVCVFVYGDMSSISRIYAAFLYWIW